MTCSHCCFACTSRGKDMTREDFQAAITLAKDYNAMITIGGGEPTLHPFFREFVMYAVWELEGISHDNGMPAVGMVTNGSNTDIALVIAKLAQRGVISAAVSKDRYHDPIDERVYKAFTKEKNQFGVVTADDHDCRSVNDRDGYILPAGRAKQWGNHPFSKCICDSVFVKPSGHVYPCGCCKHSLGHVRETVALKHEHFEGYCERDEKYKKEVLDAQE